MNQPSNTDEAVITRALDFVDERVLDTYAAACRTASSLDLVIVLDVAKRDTRAFVRSAFEARLRESLADTSEPNAILRRLRRPAAHTLEDLAGDLAFWLLITLPDGEVVCLAVGIQSRGERSIVVS